MASKIRPRLDHGRLEQAIYGEIPIGRLIGDETMPLANYRVADYVGNATIDPGRDSTDPIAATAERFFDDQGAHIETLRSPDLAPDLNVAIFATFVVIEIRPLTPQVEFLVLAPPRIGDDRAPTPYLGLMRSQNTDALVHALARPDARAELFQAIAKLLPALARKPREPRSGKGLLRRLFGRS